MNTLTTTQLLDNALKNHKPASLSQILNGRGHSFATRKTLSRIPKPAATKTYAPVGHVQLINKVEKIILGERPELTLVGETHNVSCNGQVLETSLVLSDKSMATDTPTAADFIMPTVTIRNSYNKWIPVTIGASGRIMICLNGMMSSTGFYFARKHTDNVWDDITAYAMLTAEKLPEMTDAFVASAEKMKGNEITVNEGYEVLGKLYGNGVLTASANNVAFADWNKPRHGVFEERNMWSLYNCANEGLKKVDAYSRMKSHFALHHYMTTGDFDNTGFIKESDKTGFKREDGFNDRGYKIAEA